MTKAIPTLGEHCGSDTGYQAHLKRGETACGPCRQARAVYMRGWRADNPARYVGERRRQNARLRALWRLAKLHHDEYTTLYVEELG